MNTQDALYPIREVSRLTGVNAITLRAWERRYGLFEPVRTDSGHRLFTQANIERIKAAVKLNEQGIPISQVKRFLDESGAGQAAEVSHDHDYLNGLLQAADSLDLEALNSELDSAFSELNDSMVNLVLRQVSLAIKDHHAHVMPFWESVLIPRLYVRLRNTTRSTSLSYSKRIWVQNGSEVNSELFLLLVGLHFAAQGWYPMLQMRSAMEAESLFELIQKLKCEALAVVDDSGSFNETEWQYWVQSYPALDLFYFVNQPEIQSLSSQLSVHYKSLENSF